MPTLDLKRIGNAYVADQAQCASCRGCASIQSAIVLPSDLLASDSLASTTSCLDGHSLRITFTTTNQLKTLYYSWILPLLGFVAASLIGSLAGLTDLASAVLASLAFVAGLFFCRTQGVESLTMSLPENKDAADPVSQCAETIVNTSH